MAHKKHKKLYNLGPCGKVIIHTELSAKIIFAKMSAKGKDPDHYYKCPECPGGKYHISSTPWDDERSKHIPPDVASINRPAIGSIDRLTEGAA